MDLTPSLRILLQVLVDVKVLCSEGRAIEILIDKFPGIKFLVTSNIFINSHKLNYISYN